MTNPDSVRGLTAGQRVVSAGAFLALITAGITGLVVFGAMLVQPERAASFGLVVVAFAAGVAATFNPCGLPALPGFLTFIGGTGEGIGAGRRSVLSAAASCGAMSMVVGFGIVVALVGAATTDLMAIHFRWGHLGVGAFLMAMATMHLLGRTHHFPLVSRVVQLGSRMWDGAMGKPTSRSAYAFGAGFVAIGGG